MRYAGRGNSVVLPQCRRFLDAAEGGERIGGDTGRVFV
jgi:hypothetical protein